MTIEKLTKTEEIKIRPIRIRIDQWLDYHYGRSKFEPPIYDSPENRVAFNIYKKLERFCLPGGFDLQSMAKDMPGAIILSIYEKELNGEKYEL